jgi:hypothetical protein
VIPSEIKGTCAMVIASRPQLGRRQFACACCAGTFIAWAPALARAADEVVVPVTQEPRHHTRFENEYLRIIEAIIEPGDQSLFHKHALDSVIVTAHGAKMRLEKLNQPQAWIGQLETGRIAYADFQAHPLVHRVANLDDHAAVFIDCEINVPQLGRFAASDRSGAPAYVSEIDNERISAWRLQLGPGQSVPSITQSGPGVRVVLSGDQFKEMVQGAPDREVRVRQGSYEWQPDGRRAITNTGSAPLELVEFEVK